MMMTTIKMNTRTMTNIGVFSRILDSCFWRIDDKSSRAIPYQLASCCCSGYLVATRGLQHSHSPAYRQLIKQQQRTPRIETRSGGLVTELASWTNSTVAPRHHKWLHMTRSQNRILPGMRLDSSPLRRRGGPQLPLAHAGGEDVEEVEARDFWARGMASKKTKEQPRGSLWRTRSVISKETVQAVHELKRNKENKGDLDRIFQTKIPRLLKMDLLATLSELQRQNEIELALRLFDVVRKEIWYKPDQFLYRSMMDALGRNRKIPEIEKKFQELQDEGIRAEVPIYRELVGAYVRAHMLPRALETHAVMIEKGFGEDPLSLKFIAIGKEKEAVRIKQRRKAAEKLKAEEEQALASDAPSEKQSSESSIS